MTTHKPILCLDMDGVCHSYTSGWVNAWTLPDPPVPGLFEFLEKAFEHFRVAIFSSRSESQDGRNAMREWFTTHAIEHFMYTAAGLTSLERSQMAPREAALALVMKLEFPIVKPSAFVTLDDRAITFKGEWPDVGMLRGFVVWNDHLIGKTSRDTVLKNG